jgi:hypothetical protein
MKQIGRHPLRIGTRLLLIALPNVAWLLAVRIRDWQDFRESAAEHAADALAYQQLAEPLSHLTQLSISSLARTG